MLAAQSRGARGLLGWSQTDLAKKAGLSLPTVKRYETGTGSKVSGDAVAKLRAALEAAGVKFIPENGGGAGVRLRDRSGPHDEGKRPDELDATNDD